ncbi:unnamed protein product [Ceutorhynchus assimilis]|uniref:OTU domain-containing protein n=1 Tax=Ceutorhynchus assimilis TaxID=467358 RepID=A0A9N9N1V3_9CUCU|nr:unnamed protein product [Ceutorhynchus assimilis]
MKSFDLRCHPLENKAIKEDILCLLSWNVNDCLVDLEKELAIITEQGLEGEEARYAMKIQNKGKANCDGRDMEASTLRNRRDVLLTVDVDAASGATPLNGTTRKVMNEDNEICSKPNQKIYFTRENIIGDGSCLFRAIIHLLIIKDHLAGHFELLKPVTAKNEIDVETVDSLRGHELEENNEEKGEASKMIQCQENESEDPDSVLNTKENGSSEVNETNIESTMVVGSVSEIQRNDFVLLNTQEMLNKALQENLTLKLPQKLEEYPENRPKLPRLRCNK